MPDNVAEGLLLDLKIKVDEAKYCFSDINDIKRPQIKKKRMLL